MEKKNGDLDLLNTRPHLTPQLSKVHSGNHLLGLHKALFFLINILLVVCFFLTLTFSSIWLQRFCLLCVLFSFIDFFIHMAIETTHNSCSLQIKCSIQIQPRMASDRSSHPKVFCKKGVIENFTKFTGKHLCQSLF